MWNELFDRLDSTGKVIVAVSNSIVRMGKVVNDPHPFIQAIYLVPVVDEILHIRKELHSFCP